MASETPCGGDAYKPWGGAPYPSSRNDWTCGTCTHATKEAAKDGVHRVLGARIDVPPPYGKCLGHLGLTILEEVRS